MLFFETCYTLRNLRRTAIFLKPDLDPYPEEVFLFLTAKVARGNDVLSYKKGQPTPGRHRLFFGWYMVAASWMMTFLVSAVAMSIFFKPILEEFHLDRATLSSAQTFAMLVFAFISPFMGRLMDRFGPRAILSVCVITQSLSPAVTGLAASFWHIVIGRFLFEIKSLHPTQVLINRWFIRKRGRALGIVATGMPIGTLVLSPVSQYMVLVWGWRQTLLFWSGVTFVVYLSLVLIIRNNPQDKGCVPDGEPTRPLPAHEPDKAGTGGVENHSVAWNSSSLSQAFTSASFYLLSATQLFCGVGCGFMMTHTVIFATDLGYSLMVGATFLSVQGGANLIGVLLTGYMSDRFARSRVLALTHFIRAVSFAIIIAYILMNSSSLWVIYLAMALFGFGWFTTAPLSSGLVADLFGYLRMGTIMGVTMSFHVVGMAIGAYAGGLTFVLTGSYFTFFVIQAVLEFTAAVFAFIIRLKKAV